MPPLARSETIPSIHSWWSDSNPPGATISLHAASKPLMKFMYLRQAREFVKTNHGSLLTSATAQIFATYLTYKYVSAETSLLVLVELASRANVAEDAQLLVDVLGFGPHFWEKLVHRGSSAVKRATCKLLHALTEHESLNPPIISADCCEWLVPLLNDPDVEIRRTAIIVSTRFSSTVEGARAVLNAKDLAFILNLLSESKIRREICTLLRTLTSNRPLFPLIMPLELSLRLMALTRHADINICSCALVLLVNLGLDSGPNLSQEIGAALRDNATKLLDCTDPDIQSWTCKIIARLYQDEKDSKLCPKLLRLLVSPHFKVCISAGAALANIIASSPAGGSTISSLVRKMPIPHRYLLRSANTELRKLTCDILTSMAEYIPAIPGLDSNLGGTSAQLISLLRDPESEVQRAAMAAMVSFCSCPQGARTVLHAVAFDSDLDIFSDAVAKDSAYEILRRSLAWTENLPSSLTTDDISALESATLALAQLTGHSAAAQAVADIDALAHISAFWQFPEPVIRMKICQIGGHLAMHDSTLTYSITTQPYYRIMALLSDSDMNVRRSAVVALSMISTRQAGATEITRLITLQKVMDLLCSEDSDTRKFMCAMLGQMAKHHPIPQLTKGDHLTGPCAELVRLLTDTNIEVCRLAMFALSKISYRRDGAYNVVQAQALEYAEELLYYRDPDLLKYTCQMLGQQARYKFISPSVLLPICVGLVHLLRNFDIMVARAATFALARICLSGQGVQKAVDAGALDCVAEKLITSDIITTRQAVDLLNNMLAHEWTRPLVVSRRLASELVLVLRNVNDSYARANATTALTRICASHAGKLDVLATGILRYLPEMLESDNSETRRCYCLILIHVAHRKSRT